MFRRIVTDSEILYERLDKMTQNNEHGNVPKMPSMKHLPWSQEEARQQKWLSESEAEEMFKPDKEEIMNHIIITEKMDGANACLTGDKVYARSHSGEPHREEWDYLKKRHREELMHKIPDSMAIFGEYLYAKHSIKYKDLPAYFLVFGIYYKPDNAWMPWHEVRAISKEIGLPTVPVIANLRLTSHESFLDIGNEFQTYQDSLPDRMPKGESHYGDTREGYVVRNAKSFHINNLDKNMAKCVRKNHVQTEELHWRKGGETPKNELKQN